MSERDLAEAVRLQEMAERALRVGDYARAAILFGEAAQFAITQQGIACLLAKANEARAQISGVSV